MKAFFSDQNEYYPVTIDLNGDVCRLVFNSGREIVLKGAKINRINNFFIEIEGYQATNLDNPSYKNYEAFSSSKLYAWRRLVCKV